MLLLHTWPVSAASDEDQIQAAKLALRRQIRAVVKSLPAGRKATTSVLMMDILRRQTVWLESRSILFFAPLPDEPDLWPLLSEAMAAGKIVAMPRFDKARDGYTAAQVTDIRSHVQSGEFGIREPDKSCSDVPLNRLDLVLVPGVAFDVRGWRLGRGKGHYDRVLADVRGRKCGVAFDEQLVDAVPVGPLDIRLNCILTPTRWIET